MYTRSARFYDAIYSWKDYKAETERVCSIILDRNPSARTLLDVACGSGKHLELLRDRFECEGLDYEPEFVALAKERNPGIEVHQADFRAFDLGKRFDAITCLFSAIGYADTEEGLTSAIASMARHLEPGGVLLVEPWFSPEEFRAGTTHHLFFDEPDLKIARMNYSEVEGHRSIMDMHHLVATPTSVDHFVERHVLAMFTQEQYLTAFEAAGLGASFDEAGLMGRGLYIGVRA